MEIAESFYSLSEQTRLFIYSVIFGVPMGVLFDVFRAVRIILPHRGRNGGFFVAAEDVLFLIAGAVGMMLFTSVFLRGEFRVLYALGTIWGFAIYLCAAGQFVISFLRKTFNKLYHNFFTKIFAFIRKIFTKKGGSHI